MDSSRKRWYLPAGIAALTGGIACITLLIIPAQFSMPQRPQRDGEVHSLPRLSRAALRYAPPKAPKPEKSAFQYDMHINLSEVRSAAAGNSDIVGWIYVPDTQIDYPVLQTNDNVYYVEHDMNGRPSHAGAIFADYWCDLEHSDKPLLYGHNMGNGSMFHCVKNYKDQEWGEAHPYFEIATLDRRYLYRVISFNVLCGEAGAVLVYWDQKDMEMSYQRYREYYDTVRDTSLVWYGDDEIPSRDERSQLVVLQTCNSGAADGIRCCVFAERVGDVTDVKQYSARQGLPAEKLNTCLTMPDYSHSERRTTNGFQKT